MNGLSKYSISGLKSFATYDGFAYSGKLCFDGKPVASFYNGGTGGPTDVDWVSPDAAQVFKDVLPEYEGLGKNEEVTIEQLVNASESLKKLKRALKKYVCFVTSDCSPKEYNSLSVPYDAASKERIHSFISKSCPEYTVLNELSEGGLWELLISWYVN